MISFVEFATETGCLLMINPQAVKALSRWSEGVVAIFTDSGEPFRVKGSVKDVLAKLQEEA